MSASRRRLFRASRAARARSRAPSINCQSVNGMAGMLVSTRRATTFALAQSGSMAAIRATLARTAMIFAARSDPRAIVFWGTTYSVCQMCCPGRTGYNNHVDVVKDTHLSTDYTDDAMESVQSVDTRL